VSKRRADARASAAPARVARGEPLAPPRSGVSPAAAEEQTSARTARLVAIGLFLGTLLLFSRVLGPEFAFVNYDDPGYVTENARVQQGLSVAGIRWALGASVQSNWHPLTWMSHELDVSLFGQNPRGHHATSVLLHALNAALAFLALRRLTGALWPSAWCAALFAWHPLRVESVAWVAERKDVLSGFFFFAALWAYAAYAHARRAEPALASASPPPPDPAAAAPAARKSAAWRAYALALVACALGLMAKPMLVTLPCVLLLLDLWPLRRVAAERWPRDLARLALEKVPFFALAAASSAITFFVQKAGGSVTEALSLPARLANAAVSVARYLGKFAWPADLAVLYPHPGSWPVAAVAAAVALLAVLSVGAWTQRRRRPWLAIGWLWCLGMLVPVIGLVQVGLQAMADRYTYLPLFGVTFALVWTFASSPAGVVRGGGAALGGLFLLVCAGRTWAQLGTWQNSETLFTHALAVTRDNYVAHDNRGLHRFKAGRLEEALADYRAALAINPGYLNANNNLGHALYEQGRAAEALPFFRAALAAQPGNLEVRNNLANALSDLGQLDEAMEHYGFVLARDPDHVNALNGSAVVLAQRGELAAAKARIERSLQLAPDNASAHNNLGNVCSLLGERELAVRHYLRAAALNPREPHPLVLAGTLLCQLGKYGEAADVLRRAITARPVNPSAYSFLGLALAQLGRPEEARRALQTALQQNPAETQARAWLDALSK
jgi:tetratricopeptide (TPR) repeat protein